MEAAAMIELIFVIVCMVVVWLWLTGSSDVSKPQ